MEIECLHEWTLLKGLPIEKLQTILRGSLFSYIGRVDLGIADSHWGGIHCNEEFCIIMHILDSIDKWGKAVSED